LKGTTGSQKRGERKLDHLVGPVAQEGIEVSVAKKERQKRFKDRRNRL
jgi:hypothetical protein